EEKFIKNQQSGFSDHVYSADIEKAWEITEKAVSVLYENFLKNGKSEPEFIEKFNEFRQINKDCFPNWLRHDTIFEILSLQYGTSDWTKWNGPDDSFLDRDLFCCNNFGNNNAHRRISSLLENNREEAEKYALVQFFLASQHKETRTEIKNRGLRIYGDMQVGYSTMDIWSLRDLFLKGYYLGAPPSRTNPGGQPWGYPLLDPALYYCKGNIGLSLALISARVKKMFSEFDGLRIDHPHGLVCPWVYKKSDRDQYHSVQNGARLFSSPCSPGHPCLAKYSIVSPRQISSDPDCKPYDDNRVTSLTDKQVGRYAVIIDLILETAKNAGVTKDDILCEVLSTLPYPLGQVMKQRGLGRFCVTQKADPFNPGDVYRRENAAPQDWIMAGNHDTKPLLLVADERMGTEWYSARCGVLAQELKNGAERGAYYSLLVKNRLEFRDAMVAELFLGPAKNVMMFFPDLLGMREIYNRPGVTDKKNWTLRVPRNFRDFYENQVKSGEAPKLEKCLVMALRAKFRDNRECEELCRNLENKR
ncbi:MAG: 4-alpha-glucanotransferase, partial [Fibrobacter sp.]|nr:4-alpha-glucanotransferase [Fibrobacter sp.]